MRGEGWIFLPNTIENIVYLTLDRKGLKRAEKFSFDGQKYAQEAPSIVEAKEVFGATFVGETVLKIGFGGWVTKFFEKIRVKNWSLFWGTDFNDPPPMPAPEYS